MTRSYDANPPLTIIVRLRPDVAARVVVAARGALMTHDEWVRDVIERTVMGEEDAGIIGQGGGADTEQRG